MNPQNRQRTLIIAVAVLATLFLGDKLVVTPLLQSWKDRSAKIIDLRKQVDQGDTLVARSAIIRGRWESMSTNTLPTEASTAESRVLKAFDQWAQQSHISLTSIKPQWKRSADDHSTLECRVDGFGSLSTISRFLYEVEKDPMALKVDLVELSARDNEGKQVTLGLLVSGLQISPASEQ